MNGIIYTATMWDRTRTAHTSGHFLFLRNSFTAAQRKRIIKQRLAADGWTLADVRAINLQTMLYTKVI